MATRSIVTHQPDVACDVCGRRLLRGEQPDTFIAGGRRRTVCELCVPRATHEGWLRESDAHSASLRAPRSRSARSLIDRFRQLRAPLTAEEAVEQMPPGRRRPRERVLRSREAGERDVYEDAFLDSGYSPRGGLRRVSRVGGGETPPVDVRDLHGLDRDEGDNGSQPEIAPRAEGEIDGYPPFGEEASDRGPAVSPAYAGHAEAASDLLEGGAFEDGVLEDGVLDGDELGGGGGVVTSGGAKAERALSVFNASPCADRVAGIARSLGAPSVAVRPLGESGSTVAIVVAWELCWYRYEVDLGDELAGPKLVGEGMELDELPAEDREGNARADERGSLSLA